MHLMKSLLMSNTNYHYILVRYGELSTKGKNRREFITQLRRNVKEALFSFPDLTYQDTYDRLYITLNGEDGAAVSEIVGHVFGISSFSLAYRCASDIEAITEKAAFLALQEKGTTFKVITRRHDKYFPLISDEINRLVATKILQDSDLKVDVHHPDIRVWIEVRREETFIMVNQVRGAGGYPVGVAGKSMMMLSGGIDSPVAAYLMMKRGVRIECIHFASMPYTSAQSLQKVKDLAAILTAYQPVIKLSTISFTDIQLAINKAVPESYSITIMRRFMVRIADQLAKRNNCLVIANGESIGQVASQTLNSMQVISEVASLPIVRPVVTYDKNEIIDLAKHIGTYETSILPFEDCCTIFTPKKPTTKPHQDKVEFYEEKLDVAGLIDACLENVEITYLNVKQQTADTSLF